VEVQLDALFTSALDWVRGQLYAPRGFTPRKVPGIHRLRHCGGPHPVWMLWKRQNSLGLPWMNLDFSVTQRALVMIPIELS